MNETNELKSNLTQWKIDFRWSRTLRSKNAIWILKGNNEIVHLTIRCEEEMIFSCIFSFFIWKKRKRFCKEADVTRRVRKNLSGTTVDILCLLIY